MRSFLNRFVPPIGVLAVLVGSMAMAQGDADAVIERYFAAAGGRDAFQKIHTRVAKGSFNLPDMGVYAALESYSASPDKLLNYIDLESFGTASSGVNGEIAWDINPMVGARLLTGGDRFLMRLDADLNWLLNWREYFEKAEVAGKDSVDGKPCTKILFTPSESPFSLCFDDESHLLVRRDSSRDGQAWQITLKDFRSIDGILIPFRMTTSSPQFTFEIELQSIQHNVEIPPEKFQLPPEISTLAGQ